MSPALWLLLRLHLTSWLRRLARNARTARGALLMLVGLVVFVPCMGAALLGQGEGHLAPRGVAEYGPALMLLYCFVNVVFSPSERSIYFTPAEVQFLFAGPFTRREILAYKIVLALLVSVPMTLFLGAIVRVRSGWPPAVLLGLLMVSVFMQLFSLCLGLLASAAGAAAYSVGRKLFGAAVVVLAALALLEAGRRADWDFHALWGQVAGTGAWRVATWPLRSFFDLMTATRFGEGFFVPLAVSLAVNVGLAALVLALDWGYQEASAAGSARRYAALQRMRGRSAGAEPAGPSRPSRLSLPMPPTMGGVGPVVWRQATGAARGLGRLAFAVALVAAMLVVVMGDSFAEGGKAQGTSFTFPLIAWTSIFITGMVPYDFRGDLDRIALWKSLPIVPWRLALGQMLTPSLLLTAGQWLALAGLTAYHPGQWRTSLALAACVPPYNFVLIGLDNWLFLMFPVRTAGATPGDFQAVGRNVLLSMGKLLGLMGAMTAASVVVVPVFVATESAAWAALSASPVLAAFGGALVVLVSRAFRRFDVGRDTPA